jgi:general secretion pathway protein I
VKGFTLLEVMIALAIMAGVILTVITSFNYHLSLAATDREQTVAVLLARSKLEDPDFKKLGQKSGNFSPDWPEIGWEAETTPVEIPGVQRLTLTVNWDNSRKKLALVQYLEP